MEKLTEKHLRSGRLPAGKSDQGSFIPQRFKKQNNTHRSLRNEKWRPSSVTSFLGRFLVIVAPVLLFSIIAAAVVYIRLLHAPLSLKILSQTIEKGITSQFEGLTAKIDTAILQLGENGGYEFQLINLRLLDTQGITVASTPVAEVSLDLSKILLFKVVPRKVDFINPRITFVYTKQEGFSLSFTDPNRAKKREGSVSNVAELIEQNSEDYDTSEFQSAKINIARVLTDFTARARRDENTSSSINQIGFRNAIVDFIFEGSKSQLKISDLHIDLDHYLRSSRISATARVDSKLGPWTLILSTEDSDQTGILTLKAAVKDLNPRSLSNLFPSSHLLNVFDLPTEGQIKIELKTNGELRRANLSLDVGRGVIDFAPGLPHPLLLDSGNFLISYDATTDIIQLNPSTLKWAGSFLTIVGEIKKDSKSEETPIWSYVLQSKEGSIGGDDIGLKSTPIDAFQAVGKILPQSNTLKVSNAVLRSAGAQLSITGDFIAGDPKTAGVKLEGRLSKGNGTILKAFWPRSISPQAREWARSHLRTVQSLSGEMHFSSGIFAQTNTFSNSTKLNESLFMDLKAERVEFLPWSKSQQIFAPEVFLRIKNNDVDISAPEAFILSENTKDLTLIDGRFFAKDIEDPEARGTVNFRIQSNVTQTVEALKLMRFSGFQKIKFPSDAIDGKFDGGFNISIPLVPDVEAESFLIQGRANVTDLKSKEKFGFINLQNGSVDLSFEDSEVRAKGEILLNGVNAKIDWRHSIKESEKKPAPFEFSFVLDGEGRNRLGFDVNNYIQGDVPVVVRFDDKALSDSKNAQMQVSADLTKSELIISDLAWRKAKGRPAKLQFDIVTGKNGKTELQNFKLNGDLFAIEGWVGLSNDQRPLEFNFQSFSLNLVSRLQVQGKRTPSEVWDVKARGSTFDAKDFFSSLFSFSSSSDYARSSVQKTGGLDLDVEIENVLGHSNVSLHGFRLRSSQRGDRLTKLDASGTLDGGDSLTVQLVYLQGGQRKIYADTQDAGQALRLVGFYPNMQNGRVRLEVDLDGRGSVEKTGILWIENFRVYGDPVVSEVFSGIDGDGPAIGAVASGEQRLVREVFEFDRLRMPFSVGYGQFVIEESYLKGPLLGATLRGKLDYTTQRINVGGTYIPLQGLNNALGGIPFLGEILSGPRKEGIFGITFALQGPMARPQVIVNPFSMVAPGIFREMFQMTSPNAKVLPRGQAPQPFVSQPNTYQAPAKRQKSKSPSNKLDGWSSKTVSP